MIITLMLSVVLIDSLSCVGDKWKHHQLKVKVLGFSFKKGCGVEALFISIITTKLTNVLCSSPQHAGAENRLSSILSFNLTLCQSRGKPKGKYETGEQLVENSLLAKQIEWIPGNRNFGSDTYGRSESRENKGFTMWQGTFKNGGKKNK